MIIVFFFLEPIIWPSSSWASLFKWGNVTPLAAFCLEPTVTTLLYFHLIANDNIKTKSWCKVICGKNLPICLCWNTLSGGHGVTLDINSVLSRFFLIAVCGSRPIFWEIPTRIVSGFDANSSCVADFINTDWDHKIKLHCYFSMESTV